MCCKSTRYAIQSLAMREAHPAKVALIDAKQRAILSSTVNDRFRFCAEPSPDAFTTFSSVLNLSKDETATLRAALSESGVNIGLRTQTITVLRDMMYRLCERYLNEGINSEALTIQAARDQRLIASILAIEQLTGAVQPRMVHVTTDVSEGDDGDAGPFSD